MPGWLGATLAGTDRVCAEETPRAEEVGKQLEFGTPEKKKKEEEASGITQMSSLYVCRADLQKRDCCGLTVSPLELNLCVEV